MAARYRFDRVMQFNEAPGTTTGSTDAAGAGPEPWTAVTCALIERMSRYEAVHEATTMHDQSSREHKQNLACEEIIQKPA